MRLNGLVLDLILEAISNAESQILEATVGSVIQDSRSNFVMKLALSSSPHFYVLRPPAHRIPAVSSTANEALEGNKPAIERARRLLIFLAVLWQTEVLGPSHPQVMSSFVSSLGVKMATRDPTVRTLGRDILNALTALETLVPGSLGKGKGLDCTGIWLASLDSDPEILLEACMCSPEACCFADLFDPVQLRSPTLWLYLWVPRNAMLCLSQRLGITCGIACCSP